MISFDIRSLVQLAKSGHLGLCGGSGLILSIL